MSSSITSTSPLNPSSNNVNSEDGVPPNETPELESGASEDPSQGVPAGTSSTTQETESAEDFFASLSFSEGDEETEFLTDEQSFLNANKKAEENKNPILSRREKLQAFQASGERALRDKDLSKVAKVAQDLVEFSVEEEVPDTFVPSEEEKAQNLSKRDPQQMQLARDLSQRYGQLLKRFRLQATQVFKGEILKSEKEKNLLSTLSSRLMDRSRQLAAKDQRLSADLAKSKYKEFTDKFGGSKSTLNQMTEAASSKAEEALSAEEKTKMLEEAPESAFCVDSDSKLSPEEVQQQVDLAKLKLKEAKKAFVEQKAKEAGKEGVGENSEVSAEAVDPAAVAMNGAEDLEQVRTATQAEVLVAAQRLFDAGKLSQKKLNGIKARIELASKNTSKKASDQANRMEAGAEFLVCEESDAGEERSRQVLTALYDQHFEDCEDVDSLLDGSQVSAEARENFESCVHGFRAALTRNFQNFLKSGKQAFCQEEMKILEADRLYTKGSAEEGIRASGELMFRSTLSNQNAFEPDTSGYANHWNRLKEELDADGQNKISTLQSVDPNRIA